MNITEAFKIIKKDENMAATRKCWLVEDIKECFSYLNDDNDTLYKWDLAEEVEHGECNVKEITHTLPFTYIPGDWFMFDDLIADDWFVFSINIQYDVDEVEE